MIIVITGPTCSGKSKIAIEVAKAINGEIINADAFQVYQELNIGTAKPTENDFKEVKHHLFNILKPNDNYSIYQYQKDCRECILDIISRKKTPILVGGSGLYIRSALFDFSFSDEQTKDIDMSMYESLSNEDLHKKLEEIDPDEALKIHPNNRKRVLRALYIYLAYNKTKTQLIKEQEHKIIFDDVRIFGVNVDRRELYQKIDDRVEDMICSGLVKEANEIKNKYGLGHQSLAAIGYKEIYENVDYSTEDLTKLIQKNTRNYAKRQMTFLKYQFGDLITWVRNANDIIYELTGNDINYRSTSLIGAENMSLIKTAKVMVFGVGGVGGTAVEALVRSGVTNIHIIDFDVVQSSNLNRQILFTNNDIGIEKVEAAKRRLEAINPNVKISIYNRQVTVDSLRSFPFEKVDFVVDAIDDVEPKVHLIKFLLDRNIKFISSLGMGNRIDLTKVYKTTLDKTSYDPLAKKVRSELRKLGVDISLVNVVASNEVPITNDSVVNSMIFVPSTAGLLLAKETINNVIKILKGE